MQRRAGKRDGRRGRDVARVPPPALVLPVLGLLACASVLGVRPQHERPFPHRAHVLREVRCNQCHTRVETSGSADLPDIPPDSSCLACHSPPHDPGPCGSCHGRSDRRAALVSARAHLRFSHATHSDVSRGMCVRCHAQIAEGDEVLRPSMAICLSCHEHREQWQTRTCDACHRDMEGEGTRPLSHVVHGEGFVDNHGAAAAGGADLCQTCHAESHCSRCHGQSVAALPNVLRFDRVTNAQLHRAGFVARHALEARADPTLCMTCHAESRCQQCHVQRGIAAGTDPRRSGHPPGWVGPPGSANAHGGAARADPMGCASCHGGQGEKLCVACHQVGGVGGNPHPPGFRSRKPRSELPCRRCHGGLGAVGAGAPP